MFLLIVLIQIALQQQLTHQTLRPQKINQELISDRIDCKSNQTIISDICNNCKANHAYKLDEENWLIVGVYHEFGKEYKEVIESIQKYYQKGILYATFNSEFICLSIQDAYVNLEEFLNKMYYYQLPNSFYPLDKRLQIAQNVKQIQDIIQQTIILQLLTLFLMVILKLIDIYQNYQIIMQPQTIIMYNQYQWQVTLNKSGFFSDNSQTNEIQIYQNVVGTKYLDESLRLHFKSFGQGVQSFIHETFSQYYQDVINFQKTKNPKSELTVKISKEKNVNKKKYNLQLSFD